MEADIRSTLLRPCTPSRETPPPEKRWRFMFSKSEKLLDTSSLPDALPRWLTEQDVDYFAGEFQRAGFRGG